MGKIRDHAAKELCYPSNAAVLLACFADIGTPTGPHSQLDFRLFSQVDGESNNCPFLLRVLFSANVTLFDFSLAVQ